MVDIGDVGDIGIGDGGDMGLGGYGDVGIWGCWFTLYLYILCIDKHPQKSIKSYT